MTGQLLKVNNPTAVLKFWWTLWDRLLLASSWGLLATCSRWGFLPTFTPVCIRIFFVSFVSHFYNIIIIIMKEEANCIITFAQLV